MIAEEILGVDTLMGVRLSITSIEDEEKFGVVLEGKAGHVKFIERV